MKKLVSLLLTIVLLSTLVASSAFAEDKVTIEILSLKNEQAAQDAFNELCEISHANKGIDQENTIGRRTLLVQSVCIKAIHALTPYQNERLEQQLKDIASDYPEHRHLHFRR